MCLSLGLLPPLEHSSPSVCWQCYLASFYPWCSQQLGQSATSSVRLCSVCSSSGARVREAIAPSASSTTVSWTQGTLAPRGGGLHNMPHRHRGYRGKSSARPQPLWRLLPMEDITNSTKGIPLQICPTRNAGLGDGYSSSGSSSTRKAWAICPWMLL